MRDIRLLVASPSLLVVRGVIDLVSAMDDAIVVASARTREALVNRIAEHAPDVLLVDVCMVDALHASAATVDMRMLVLGTRHHVGTQPSFQPQMACGYLAHSDAQLDASGAIATLVRCPLPHRGAGGRCLDCALPRTLALPPLPLSEREYDIFERIGHGHGATRMASDLGISVKTIETHRESIKRKLRLDSAHALLGAAWAWRKGEALVVDGGASRRRAPARGADQP